MASINPENLVYEFCDDWFIFASDTNGNLHYVSTELWPDWIDAAAEKFGVHRDSKEALYRAEELDQEDNAVERYMLPIARERWNWLPWQRIPEEEGVV